MKRKLLTHFQSNKGYVEYRKIRYSFKALALVLLQFFILFGMQTIYGQEEKLETKNLKNSIKLNITNPMIFGTQCYMIGYERTIGNHQSFSVNIGRFSLPKIFNINTDSIKELSKATNSRGFHISGDYRFYLSKENKYNSPHGVYIGPYATYNSYNRDFSLSANTQSFTGDLNAKFNFNVATVGFQLGYQFVFWKRVSLDMVLFGPGVAAYKVKTELSTTLDPDQEAQVFQKINEALNEKIPGYDLALNPGSFEKTGSLRTTSAGFRYIVMLGIRF
jgi:hypothetical protein